MSVPKQMNIVRQIPIRGFDENFSYFIKDPDSRGIAVVDPGDLPHLVAEIDQDGLEPKMVLVTHTHFDHVDGVNEMVEKYGIPVFMHENARGKLAVGDEMCVFLRDGEQIHLGGLKIDVLHTPGHIDDAVCFFIPAKQCDDGKPRIVTGDSLFVEGCGRADLAGSNVEDLYKSLQRLKKLPDDTLVYPGHNYGSKPVSTIAHEKRENRYLKCSDFEEFRRLRMGL